MTRSDHLKKKTRPAPHAVTRAVRFMRQNLGREFSTEDLATYCGVADRTLRKHFHAFMGVSPREYWRRLRLAAARKELLKGGNATSVTKVASRLGFDHFSRFAQQYRGYFNELPSETLRRSRGARPCGAPVREDGAEKTNTVATVQLLSGENLRSQCCRVRSPPPRPSIDSLRTTS
jgi:transcriptional regulator GlxA family with amidase domain